MLALLLFGLIASPLIAQPSPATGEANGNDDPALCSRPAETVCRDSEAFERNAEKMQRVLVAEALEKARKSDRGRDLQKAFDIIEKNPHVLELGSKKEFAEFQRALFLYLETFRQVLGLTAEDLQEFSNSSMSAVVEAVQDQAGLEEKNKDAFVERVKGTESSHFETALRGSVSVAGIKITSTASLFLKKCGWQGTGTTALNSNIDATIAIRNTRTGEVEQRKLQGNVISMCPLLFIMAKVGGNELGPNISVLHEYGHSLDQKYFPELYRPMLACFEKEYRSFSGWPQTAQKEPAPVAPFAGELIADFWSAEALAKRVSHEKGLEKRRLLANQALVVRCPMQESSAHPAGTARIDFIMRNPALRKALGCSAPSPEKRSCGLKGASE